MTEKGYEALTGDLKNTRKLKWVNVYAKQKQIIEGSNFNYLKMF